MNPCSGTDGLYCSPLISLSCTHLLYLLSFILLDHLFFLSTSGQVHVPAILQNETQMYAALTCPDCSGSYPPRQFQSRNVRFHPVHFGELALRFTIETHQNSEISRALLQGRSHEYRTGKLHMTRCGCRSSRTTLADTSSVVDRLSGRNHGVFRVRGTPTACMGVRGSPSSGKAQIVYLYTTPFHRKYARRFQRKVD